jgi:hypothetical protein
MGGFAVLRIVIPDCAGYVETPVAALSYVFVVAQREHELVAGFGVLFCGEAARFDAGAEAVVWEGGGHDVEGWAAGGREEGEDGEDFEEGTGP